MAGDLGEAADTLGDEFIADLEIDEDLLNSASGDDGDYEEEEAVCAALHRHLRRGRPGARQVWQGRSGARERPGWQGAARCRGTGPEVSVGRRRRPCLHAAGHVRG